MISKELQKQIEDLCQKCPEARPIINAVISSFGQETTTASPVPLPKEAAVYQDISMILPQRRRCSALVNQEGVWLKANDAVILDFGWSEIIEIACVPVIGKARPTYNLIFAKENPQNTVALTLTDAAADKHREGSKIEPLYISLIREVQTSSGRSVQTNPSQVVPAHNGSKEGVLYMLEDAVIYGNKKPVLYLPHTDMASFSFTVITRLTFNIVVKMNDGNQYEFSIIDQDHFYGISKYVADKGLIDESLAETRAAKRARPDDGEAMGESNLGEELAEGPAEDMDDRESDVDVHFSDEELNSDGSGASEDEEGEESEEESDALDSSDVDEKINEIQVHQAKDQEDDEEQEELALQAFDDFDTNMF